MSSDSEDEDFAEYGIALDPLNEDELPRKKPTSLNDQVATDEHGRRRFHGAFTGGFSAGFFNTVGSLEGWSPSTFKSSRSDKAKEIQQKPEDFMDDEDMDEFGISPKVLRARSDFNDGSKKRARRHDVSDGPIPGEPVLRELLQPVKETVGMKLLRKMGWKPGQGTGPRVTKMEKRKMKQKYKKTEVKVYGCALPQDADREKQYGSDSSCSTDDENDPEVSFAPSDYQPFLCKPKDNYFGLGYSGLDRRSVLSSNLNLFTPTPLRMEEKKKKVLISGQAFGVGAFEEDDEDIYAREDMSQYDFILESEPTTSKQKQQTTVVALANYYAGNTLIGFVLGTNAMTRKKYFLPPVLPQGFKPVHVTRKSRFEPAPAEKLSQRKEEQSHTSRKKGLQQYNLTATDRAQILSETTPKSAVQEDNVGSPTQEKCERLPATELTKTENPAVSKKGYSHFQPFLAHPEKQKRYEQYLILCKVGQKDRLSYIQPLTMTEWEKERERVEFEQAARLYQPLSGVMSDRFVSASQPEDMNSPLSSIKKDADNDSDQRAAAKLKMFGCLTREETEWRPCSLLCKRFNIPELCAGGGGGSSDATPKSTSQFSVFNFLDAASYNRALKPHDSPVCNEPDNDILAPPDSAEVITKQESESGSNGHNEAFRSEQKSEDSLLEFPDPPAKIDLYKAIFLSSSEDSDSDSSEINSANITKGSKSKEMMLSETNKTEDVHESVPQEERETEDKETASDKTVISAERNAHRNMSPPRGVFANLDLDALNTRKEKSNRVLENKEELDMSQIKPPINENHVECEQNKLEQIEDNMYGPQLPSVLMVIAKNTSLPVVKTVLPSVVGSVHTEWVEKAKTVSHKSKHNKKHKKSSKHKKHKHKKKRH